MAADPSELYLTVAPIAAVFAGFGSLATALGDRRGGDHARVDAMRLNSMLSASLSATLLAFLPVALTGLLLNAPLAVRAAALVAVISMVALVLTSVQRARQIRGLPGFSMTGAIANTVCTIVASGAFVLCLLDALPGRLEALYFLGLVALLASSAVMFSRVIASMLRPHDQP